MSNKTLFAFVVGAALGSLLTWVFMRQTCNEKAQNEINEMREHYLKKAGEQHEKTATVSSLPRPAASVKTVAYDKVIQDCHYISDSETDEAESIGKRPNTDEPYIISPEEFDSLDTDIQYPGVTLTWYADCILADDNNEIIEDVEDIVGFEALSRFKEFGADAVYVRNEAHECDYEILRDSRRYADVHGDI